MQWRISRLASQCDRETEQHAEVASGSGGELASAIGMEATDDRPSDLACLVDAQSLSDNPLVSGTAAQTAQLSCPKTPAAVWDRQKAAAV